MPIPDLKTLKRPGLLLGITLSIGAIACIVGVTIWLSGQTDRFEFMDGHSAIAHGVGGYGQSSEYMIYTWQQDYALVEPPASRELSLAGFVGQKKKNCIEWTGPKGLVVQISQEHARPCRPSTHEAGWVTVVVGRFLPDNLMTTIRSALSGCTQ